MKRKLALLLALCLLATMLPAGGLTENLTESVSNDAVFIVTSEDADIEAGIDEPIPLEQTELLIDEAAKNASDDEASVVLLSEAVENAGESLANVGEEDGAEPEDPHIDPEGPRLSAYELTLGAGEEYDLQPEPPEGKTGEIALFSSDERVAEVSPEGVVTANKPGNACITAWVEEGVYAECLVHVKKAPNKVAFTASKLSLGKGETLENVGVAVGSDPGKYAGSYTLSSDDEKIVKVCEGGALKGVKKGSTILRVTTYNGKTAKCKVTVVNAPDRLQASTDTGVLGVDETGQVNCQLPSNTAGHVTFMSEEPSILEVDADTGATRGLAPGKTRVIAETYNGKRAYVSVTVKPAPQALTFDAETVRLAVGMKLPVEASLDEGAAGTITYTVKKKSVASWANSVLEGVKKGKTVLVAETYNGLTATCAVEVLAAPKYVKLPYTTLDIGVKQSMALTPDVGKSVSSFTYTSSNKKIVNVNAAGVVTGVKKGSAVVKIKTFNDRIFKLKVNVVNAPGSLSLSPDCLELGVDETGRLEYALPKGTAAAVTFSSDDPSVAEVDSVTGLVRGVAPGAATITATTHNGKTANAEVVVYSLPEWIQLPMGFMELAEGQSTLLTPTLSPGSRSPLYFFSEDESVAVVSMDGVVTGVGAGQTTVTVGTNVPEITAQVTVSVLPAPEEVSLKTRKLTLNAGETTQMVPVIPEGTYTVFTYGSSNESVATVSADGLVTTHAKGKAVLTVATHNGKTAKLKLTVLDPWFPDEVKLLNAPSYMKAGDSLQLQWSVKPEGAIADLKWYSSDESVAAVDRDGMLYALGIGYATITAVSARNASIELSFALGVESDSVTLEIPARTTSIEGIAENMNKIFALRASAFRQIEILKETGVITGADASKRRSIVENAFKDYAFPWMTLNKQKYWRKANSEGGAKDFKPDRVYYGMPYNSLAGKNRTYNVAKAIKESRFTDSGKGYYVLNQKKLLNGSYCGNDCSCFVDAAIWGTGSSHSNDRTTEISKSSAYKTVKGFDSMRTGDLICLAGHHVVMFLYYVNADKSKIMIIENGGIEPGTNTVHCMIMNTKWYTSRGYKVRRLKSLG